jgi:UDP-N-acetylmuramoyl-L-alanyl-D-glutamate--2,6-diaminopimelate ligase
MERVDAGQAFTAIVDFAHTPYGLQQALQTCRRILTEQGDGGRLLAVFGSAGRRDVAKRRMMSETAARLADMIILTAEDPRTDSLADILAAMADGCRSQGAQEGKRFWRIPDRGQAIHTALGMARAGDLVIICGKAHEQSMCFGSTEFPWDDLVATRTALQALQAGAPMPNLGLPTYDPQFQPPVKNV